MENELLNHILLWLMILCLHQIILEGLKKIFLAYMIKIMTINDQITDEKLQYDISREAAKIAVLLSRKIHKYEYLTGEDILPSNQQQITEQAKFTYSPLGKVFEKQIKTIDNKGQKQIDALKDLKDLKDQNKQLDNISDYKDDLLHSKGREIFKKNYEKRLDKIEELT